VSAYLLVPYLIWLIFAAILNYSIYFLNWYKIGRGKVLLMDRAYAIRPYKKQC
jgi:hypothetical protein